MANFRRENLQAILKNLQNALFGSTETEVEMSIRKRFTIAEINAGATLVAATVGYKYAVRDMAMISVGGAVGATTTVDILGTRSAASVKLLAVAIAALTQSALVRAGATNATILADGASFTDLDQNTAITVGKTGATATTATHVDVFCNYVVKKI